MYKIHTIRKENKMVLWFGFRSLSITIALDGSGFGSLY